MRLVTFSDGHVGEYLEGYANPASGLNTRLEDTLNVWTWIHQLAVDRKADCVVFGGDRFKPKRPPAWMRDLADARLVPFRESGIPVALLKGNHDMWDKAARWSSYGGVATWRRDKDPLWVFDQPGVLDFCGVCFAFLPYGFHTVDLADLNPDGSNILFFHDDVDGLSNYGAFLAQGGISRQELDREEFMLVLGGHVHLRQELPFRNTTAYHIGTPLERIEDGDQGPKGAFIIDIEDNGVQMEFVESPLPKVVRHSFEWAGDIEECVASVPQVKGNIVQLIITHRGTVSSGLRREALKKLRDREAASVDVRLQAVYDLEDSSADVIIGGMLPLEDEAVEWTRKKYGDDKLTACLEQVIKRAQ